MKFIIGTFILLVAFSVQADHHHSFKLGSANIAFNNDSGYLSDNLGGVATPVGITAQANDTQAIVFSYDYFLTNNWVLQFAAGIPPEVKLQGAGSGAELGVVGSAKSITPGIVAIYHSQFTKDINLYFGIGINYSTYSNTKVSEDFTASFHGTESTVSLSDSVGEIVKFGFEYNISSRLFLDVSTSYYGAKMEASITTSGNPMLGDITRNISSNVNPSILAIMIGLRM